MDHVYDVAVIGGGCAGEAAGMAAAAAGARVAVIAAGPGATGLAGGGWTGPTPARLLAGLANAGLPVLPAESPLPHPVGGLRSCDHVAASHHAARATGGALVLGVAGLPGFRAAALARLWGAAAGEDLFAATVQLPGTPAGGWAPASLAGALQRDPGLLADAIAVEVRRVRATRVIVPAVLGADGWSAVHAATEAAAGVPVGEAAGAPPSLPGLRLTRALRRAGEEVGITHIAGRVTGVFASSERLDAVTVTTTRQNVHVAAHAWVLATGSFVGGGIRAEPDWLEPAFRIPVSLHHLQTRHGSLDPLAHSSPDRRAPQVWQAIGVVRDAQGRPVASPAGPDIAAPAPAPTPAAPAPTPAAPAPVPVPAPAPAAAEPVFTNVFAAGAVVAGVLPGLGTAAADGWTAGERAAAAAAASAAAPGTGAASTGAGARSTGAAAAALGAAPPVAAARATRATGRGSEPERR